MPAIGASGAISGVLGAYLFLYPQARIQTLIFFGFFARFILVPAWVFLPFWFLIQLISGVASLGVPNAQQGGGVAFFAHIGGFVAGPILLFLLGGGRQPRAADGDLGLKRRLARLLLLALLLGAADAFWIEPRLLLFRDDVRIDLPAPRMRIAHLSDLHIRGDMPHLHRLLREVAAARPDVVVISGDLIHDVPDAETYARTSSAVAALVAGLRRIAPVYAVQGHSEHQGNLVGLLQRAGLEWLSNEGRRIGPGRQLPAPRPQHAGRERPLAWRWPSPFRPVTVDGVRLYGATRGEPYRNFYSHYDPAPAGLADTGGPLSWSGYEVTCDARIDDEKTGAGIALHSRYVDGEDRHDRAQPRRLALEPAGQLRPLRARLRAGREERHRRRARSRGSGIA